MKLTEHYTQDQLMIVDSLDSNQEAVDYAKTFLYAKTIQENDTKGWYAEFIEERRLKEQEKFKELEAIKERTKQEQEKYLAYAPSSLDSDSYFSINWSKPRNVEDFFALNPEAQVWKTHVEQDIRDRKIELESSLKESHPEIAEERTSQEYEMAAVMDKMGDFFSKPSSKLALDGVRLLVGGPLALATGKAISKVLTTALKTETGQEMISGMKNMWEKKFGKSMGIKNKGLKAAAIAGMVTVGGATALALGIDPSDFKEVFDVVQESLPELEIQPMEVNIDPSDPSVQMANHYLASANSEIVSNSDAFIAKAQAAMDAGLNVDQTNSIDSFLARAEATKISVPDVDQVEVSNSADELLASIDENTLDTEQLSASVDNDVEVKNDATTSNLEMEMETETPNVSDTVTEPSTQEPEVVENKTESPQQEPKTESVPAFPDAFVIEKGDTLENLVEKSMPEGTPYEDIKKMTLQIAEHNGLQDADKIFPGQTFEIPEFSEAPDPTPFKIDGAKDLFALDKVPYGSDITPIEYKAQVGDVLKEMYPDEPERLHEMMAHVNGQMNGLPANEPIPSGTKIGLSDEYKGYLEKKSFDISDEQESPLHGFNDDGTAIKELEKEVKTEKGYSNTEAHNQREYQRNRYGR